MEMMVPRRVQERREAKENQRLLKESSRKAPTQRQLNTLHIIHELVAEYDNLQRLFTEEPTNINKRKILAYSLHLKSVNQLSEYFIQYTMDKDLDTLNAPSKIRALITNEIKSGTLVKINGLIRTPHTVPYENVSASGNVITVILPPHCVSPLVDALVNNLIDEPVKFIVPCNNMVTIIEIGNYKPSMDPALVKKIHETVFLFFPDYNLMIYTDDNKPNTLFLK